MPWPVTAEAPFVFDARVACAAVAIARRPGEYIASSKAALVAGLPTAKTVAARPSEIEAEMESPPTLPRDVDAIWLSVLGPASCVGGAQCAPPSGDEMYPTSS